LSIRQPALFVAGTEDAVIRGFGKAALDRLPNTVPGLKRVLLIDGAGHWVQQQRAREVNAGLLDFLHQFVSESARRTLKMVRPLVKAGAPNWWLTIKGLA
jgi:hypothetical protein